MADNVDVEQPAAHRRPRDRVTEAVPVREVARCERLAVTAACTSWARYSVSARRSSGAAGTAGRRGHRGSDGRLEVGGAGRREDPIRRLLRVDVSRLDFMSSCARPGVGDDFAPVPERQRARSRTPRGDDRPPRRASSATVPLLHATLRRSSRFARRRFNGANLQGEPGQIGASALHTRVDPLRIVRPSSAASSVGLGRPIAGIGRRVGLAVAAMISAACRAAAWRVMASTVR